jgi:hypothetical protein
MYAMSDRSNLKQEKKRMRPLNLSLARRIRAAGCQIAISEDDDPRCCNKPSEDAIINQTGGQLETRAFDHSGGTGWLVSISIAVQESRFAISSFAIETPWEKMGFCWIVDPLEHSTDCIYRLASLQFDRDEILNHRANSKPLQRGTLMDGFLLGTDMATIPSQFRRREIDVTLVIYDQFDQQHRASLKMFVEQLVKQSQPRTKRAGLFDRRDPVKRGLDPNDPRDRWKLNPANPDHWKLLSASYAKYPKVDEPELAKFLKSLETTMKKTSTD